MANSQIVRAAAAQISPVLFSREGTTEKVLDAIGDAARKGVQLIVFPETFVPYYPYFSFVQPPVLMGADHMRLYEEAVTVPGPVVGAVAAAAKAHTMVVLLGVNELEGGSLYKQSAAVRCGRSAAVEATQNHAHLSRAYGVGAGGRRWPHSSR